MSSDPLLGVRVKIDRAKKHLEQLEAEIGAFLDSQPYTLVMDEDAEARRQIYRVRQNAAIPCHWGGMIGDIIHNLRSSLDQLAVALVVANGKTSKTAISETYFPISSSKNSFSSKKIRRASPKAIRLVERLKPYKGGIDDFWRIHELDVLDKHRVLVPVGAAHTHVGIRFRMDVPWEDEQIVMPPVFFQPANKQYPLQDGTEIFRYNAGDGPVPQSGDVQCTVTISFGEGQIFDGEPVAPTLKQLIDFMERVVDIFDRRILNAS